MKVSTKNGNNFGYEKITILVHNIPLNSHDCIFFQYCSLLWHMFIFIVFCYLIEVIAGAGLTVYCLSSFFSVFVRLIN
jgi:hypothetical protein